MKAKLLIAAIQAHLDAVAKRGGNPDLVEVCLYCPEPNYHNDFWEVTNLDFERGDPDYIEIRGVPQDE